MKRTMEKESTEGASYYRSGHTGAQGSSASEDRNGHGL